MEKRVLEFSCYAHNRVLLTGIVYKEIGANFNQK